MTKWRKAYKPKAHNCKLTKTHKDSDQANKYDKQQDKNDKEYPCFSH